MLQFALNIWGVYGGLVLSKFSHKEILFEK